MYISYFIVLNKKSIKTKNKQLLMIKIKFRNYVKQYVF